MTIRLCKTCGGWHDLGEPWPCSKPVRGSLHIIKDIEPYRAIAAGRDGKRPVITSRRAHREFLKDNGYVEVGNSASLSPKQAQYDLATPRDVKQAIDQLRNR